MTNEDNEYNRRIKDRMFNIDKKFVSHEEKMANTLGMGFSGGCMNCNGACNSKLMAEGLSGGFLEDRTIGGAMKGIKKYKKKTGGYKCGEGASGGAGMSGGAITTTKIEDVKNYSKKMTEAGISGGAKKMKKVKEMKVEVKVEKMEKPKMKRSDIVKQIMKEKGLKMIEASKYVKDNKLY